MKACDLRRNASGLRRLTMLFTICGTMIVALVPTAAAKTWCVNPGGTSGCFSSINAAVTAAAAGDVITVARGVYPEDVMISKPLSLVGQEDENTVIDASGKLNGITITSTRNVLVTGFTVENANTAGIWITNSSFVTISDNHVIDNDKALAPGVNTTCPPLAGGPFESGEDLDCGEGVFLSGVDHSVLENNLVTRNAGGILLTDDTGPSSDNLIRRNRVVHNTQFDCGITLPSHSGAGVFHNTVADNDSSYNGGPGVGIFAPGPGRKAYGNVVIGNRLNGNGLPGVTMHNHAAPGVGGVPSFLPQPIFNDNKIIGNDIADNSPDEEDAATTGPTGIRIYSVGPMTGTVVANNRIDREAIDVAITVPAAPNGITAVQIYLNDLLGNHVGVQNSTAANVDAIENWWGCSGGPGASGCSSVSGTNVTFTPWLTRPAQSER